MRDLPRNLELLRVLSRTQIKIRYKKATLGYVWSLAHPLAFAMVFYFVFQVVMKADRADMAAFLVAGLFPWQWISNSLVQGTMIFIANGSLVKKVAFPRHMLPLSMVIQDGWHFALSLPVLTLVLLMSGHSPEWAWLPGIPLMIVLQTVLLYGLALIVGSINMFLRDIEHLVQISMMLLFYGTPLVYEMKQVPPDYAAYMALNPFTALISAWRGILLDGVLPWDDVLATAIAAVIAVVLGTLTFRSLSNRFAELI